MKADICAKTVEKYSLHSNQALAEGQATINACSFVIVQVYSDYAQFLTDLQDTIVSKRIEEMNEQLQKVQSSANLTKETDDVNNWLKQQAGQSLVTQTQDVYNQILGAQAAQQAALALQ